MNPHIYILTGLGADHHVYDHIKFPENHTHLPWIPEVKNEDISSYAKRMAEGIIHNDVVLVGLSFGGIVAQEIAKIRPVKKLVLLSTVKGRHEMTFYMPLIGRLKVIRFIPNFILTKSSFITTWAFGLKTKEGKQMLKYLIEKVSADHLRWAIQRICLWDNVESADVEVVHIHGRRDRAFPNWGGVKPDYSIGRGHFAVYENAAEVQAILDKELSV